MLSLRWHAMCIFGVQCSCPYKLLNILQYHTISLWAWSALYTVMISWHRDSSQLTITTACNDLLVIFQAAHTRTIIMIIQCFHSSAVNAANPDPILRGILPIFDGWFILSILSWIMGKCLSCSIPVSFPVCFTSQGKMLCMGSMTCVSHYHVEMGKE